jgi:ADP-heptose:LPS heptosyltransferase
MVVSEDELVISPEHKPIHLAAASSIPTIVPSGVSRSRLLTG